VVKAVPALNICIIDDEPSVLLALRLLLQTLGNTVTTFSDPLAATGEILALTAPPDIVLCDLRMPKRNGLGVLDELRRLGCNVPFLLMSAHASPEEVAEGTRRGANGFLSKPFSPANFNARLATLTAGHEIHTRIVHHSFCKSEVCREPC
jgi:CheY-like chemotaxis protein